MSEQFFKGPILNSPYECPTRHWELVDGIPTQEIVESRRESRLITPIPQPRKRGGKGEQVQQRSYQSEDPHRRRRRAARRRRAVQLGPAARS